MRNFEKLIIHDIYFLKYKDNKVGYLQHKNTNFSSFYGIKNSMKPDYKVRLSKKKTLCTLILCCFPSCYLCFLVKQEKTNPVTYINYIYIKKKKLPNIKNIIRYLIASI